MLDTKFRQVWSDGLIPCYTVIIRFSLELSSTHGVRILDMYRIAKPLNDLTYDDAHYQGIVGWMLATYVLEKICGGRD